MLFWRNGFIDPPRPGYFLEKVTVNLNLIDVAE